MKPAYALFRRSRSHQDLSIEEQREAVRGWATEHGYQIVREFADDGSGLDTERRRDFLTLLNVCGDRRRREADTVLCYDVSRFSRLEPDEAAFHEYSLRRAGVHVIYTHEAGANETGVAGQIIKTLKRVMAHDYSQKLSQVVSRGLRAHAALGHWTGGTPPYGYRRGVRQADGSVGLLPLGRWKAKGETVSLVVDAGEARVVREDIYEAYVQRGLGIAAIAHRLNARGVPAPASLRRRGTSAWGEGDDLGDPQERGLHRHAGVREVALLGDRQEAGEGPSIRGRSCHRCGLRPRDRAARSLGRRLGPTRHAPLRKRAPVAPAVPLEQPDRVRALRQAGACPQTGQRADPESLRLRRVRRVGPRRL